ncbi:hypothetical protein DEJ38_07435 [Kocuria rosea]|nr:hypothetical protein DEJ38_07435 [Kocuria rosea]
MISPVTGSIISSVLSVVKSVTAVSFRIRPDPHTPFFLQSPCGATGGWHDTFTRWFTHLPVGRAATKLQVQAPRYRCRGCGKVWRHRLRTVAQPRSKLTRSAVWWALCQVVLDHCSISAVAAVLQTAWGTVHDAVTDLGQQVLIEYSRLTGPLDIASGGQRY